MHTKHFAAILLAAFAAAPVLAEGLSPSTVKITVPVSVNPQLGEAFRIVKPDGATIIQQGKLSASAINTITVSDKDAFLAANGKCAFNVKYDEVASGAVNGTTNRLYSNDALIAQNTKIDLLPNVVKTIWTQPYLVAGNNNVRVVVNADGAQPSTKWIKVNVTGTCGAAPAPVVAPKPAPAPAPAPAPVVRYAPGSTQWQNLNLAWGYSNFATTQLKNANYARYAELVKLNAAITAAINAKTIEQKSYDGLMASWNSFVNDEAFKKLMAAVPSSSERK